MLTYRDLITGFRKLDIDRSKPVITHASLKAFGELHGGVNTILGALLSSVNILIMPAFTYRTMIIPGFGPAENGITYGSGIDTNPMAEFYRPDMPADPQMGILAEAVRTQPGSARSIHPILSFSGVNAKPILGTQTLQEPLLPIQALAKEGGWVLLLGLDHTSNTSIHYGEKLAGRRQFVRWALTPKGVIACPDFPGCSAGFGAISAKLEDAIHSTEVGEATVQAIPLVPLLDTVCMLIHKDPSALLCAHEGCERCNAVRASLSGL